MFEVTTPQQELEQAVVLGLVDVIPHFAVRSEPGGRRVREAEADRPAFSFQECGAAVCSTAPQDHHSRSTDCGQLVHPDRGGVDHLELTLYGSHEDDMFAESLFSALSQLKVKAQQGHDVVVRLENGWQLLGTTRSSGRGASFCPYVFWWDGLCIHLAHRTASETVSEGQRSVIGRVEVHGMYLLEHGFADALHRISHFFETIGLDVDQAEVSRVDFAFDVIAGEGAKMKTYAQALFEGRVICRAKGGQWGVKGSALDCESVTIGSRKAIYLRIYDKLKEVGDDQRKLDLLMARRWGGSLPANVVRVEFEVRREALTSRDCGSLDQLCRQLPALVRYLCCEWVRISDASVDRHHTDRNRGGKVWQTIQQGFECWAGRALSAVARVKSDAIPKRDHLRRMIAGCLLSWVARSKRVVEDVSSYREAMADVMNDVFERVADRASHVVACQKRVRFLAMEGGACPF